MLCVHIKCATACTLKKLNFKLLYLRNYISYWNKICRICCVNTRIQSLKVWLKYILPWLKYSIFSRGLFFIGAPCIMYNTLNKSVIRKFYHQSEHHKVYAKVKFGYLLLRFTSKMKHNKTTNMTKYCNMQQGIRRICQRRI